MAPWTRLGRSRWRGVLRDGPVDDDPRCASCGGVCCRSFVSVPLSWSDFERLEALGAQRLELALRGPHRLVIDGGCEFLVAGRCAIYADRPEACRRFMCAERSEEVHGSAHRT
jgi:Fe-S-cluster containining protein